MNAGFREFRTEPVGTDAFGLHQTLQFTYETKATNKQRQGESSTNLEQTPNTPHAPDSTQDPLMIKTM